jgi:hypothetical protein
LTARILSQDGNVIAAQFDTRFDLTFEINTEILLCDGRVFLMRVVYLHAGRPVKNLPVQHFLYDLETGRHTVL